MGLFTLGGAFASDLRRLKLKKSAAILVVLLLLAATLDAMIMMLQAAAQTLKVHPNSNSDLKTITCRVDLVQT
jgi:hypothetical protein